MKPILCHRSCCRRSCLSVFRSRADATPPIVAAQPSIVTRGQAIVTARPDRAFVTIAAESRSKLRRGAKAERRGDDRRAAED